jgi:hypothetical protein
MIANNQMGGLASPWPAYGVQMTNSSNGGFYNNYIWSNVQGAQFSTSHYNRIFSNRFEESQKEGAIFNGNIGNLIQNNWFNANGELTVNTYDHLRLQSIADSLIDGNVFYDWNGGTTSAKYAGSIESIVGNITIRGNLADKYGTAAWYADTTQNFTNISTDGALQFSSGSTIAAGSTVYIGNGFQSATEGLTQQYIASAHTVIQLYALASSLPGAGQSYVYTLRVGGVSTGITCTMSGSTGPLACGANAGANVADYIANGANYSVQVVTSAGAAVTNHIVMVKWIAK